MISAMSSIYAMQRANGDWFALEEREKFRVPVFSSNSEAMQARAFNVEMLVFKPVLLDARAQGSCADRWRTPRILLAGQQGVHKYEARRCLWARAACRAYPRRV